MDQCPAPRLLGPMGSISISDDTSAVAGLGGTGLAASAHRTKLAARIATRTATTRNKSRRRRASMASQEETNAPLELDGSPLNPKEHKHTEDLSESLAGDVDRWSFLDRKTHV